MRGLFGAMAAPNRKAAATLDSLPGFLLGPESSSGEPVNFTTALQVTAMLACARVVAEGLAQCRPRLMRPRQSGVGHDVATDHTLHRLLNLEPFPRQTAFDFWATMVIHLMLVGNAFAFINRASSGRILELVLLEPGHVTVTRLPDLTLVYDVTSQEGNMKRLPAESIWHIRGPSWNGWMGMETIRVAREALGLSMALEKSHARMHRNDLQQAGFYSIEGALTPDQHAKLTEWLRRYAAAGDLAGQAMILDNNAKWLNKAITGVDAQHLETRRFEIEEVCRAVRVMPIMIGQADKTATYASAEQMFLAHTIHTLSPWAERLEQSAEVSLLTEAEKRQGLTLQFDLERLMRGDFKGRQEGLQIQRRNAVLNANEWRAKEGMNPRTDPGGDQYIIEANMQIQDGRDLTPQKTTPTPQGN